MITRLLAPKLLFVRVLFWNHFGCGGIQLLLFLVFDVRFIKRYMP